MRENRQEPMATAQVGKDSDVEQGDISGQRDQVDVLKYCEGPADRTCCKLSVDEK